MKRLIEKDLLDWKNSARRKPLIVRGARQVGKTYSIKKFGEDQFESTLVVDLERNPNWHRIFESDLDPKKIKSELEIVLNARIIPGRTLLFMDEIQSCPRVIMALRYLYEELPELHVIAAGSLLEFVLGQISFPVGRVQFYDMHPMSFVEYLWALKRDEAANILLSPPSKQPETVHNLFLEELRRYFFVGGMPESVSAYVSTGSFKESFAVHKEICDTYRQDFSKYTPYADSRCLDGVFTSTARRVGQQIKYAHLLEDFTNPTIKKAFDLLCRARILNKIPTTSPEGLPLGAASSSRVFKALVLDIGLMQHLCGMPVDVEYAHSNLLSIYNGAMAEQFAGQEMMLSQGSELYYWSRRARGSSAEVDYLIVKDGRIHPVEIKSSSAGRLKSLHLLLDRYPDCREGLVFSCAPYSELPGQKLTFLPLYFVYSATLKQSKTYDG